MADVGYEIPGYAKVRYDYTSNPFYEAYYNEVGDYFIVKPTETGSTGVIEYFRGSGDISTDWGNRASLTYLEYPSAF